ncbi:hypothetical protein RF11_13291 [Thelohanellus kitauei]|uniref:Uncharacterized protein n=1 Tax=Thelohanellus kitauei TaxID=669202 RepID=A0A0C2N9W7_THEKT|nr:hypothetical protein RF11_13291 [Thelohanellus kitauei]
MLTEIVHYVEDIEKDIRKMMFQIGKTAAKTTSLKLKRITSRVFENIKSKFSWFQPKFQSKACWLAINHAGLQEVESEEESSYQEPKVIEYATPQIKEFMKKNFIIHVYDDIL